MPIWQLALELIPAEPDDPLDHRVIDRAILTQRLDLLGSDAIDGRQLRGYLLFGDQDPRRDDCERLAHRLRDAGVEVRAEVIKGLGHDYPPDFEDRLPEVLGWATCAV